MVLSSFLFSRVVWFTVLLLKPPTELADTAINRRQAVELWREASDVLRASGVNAKLRRPIRTIGTGWKAARFSNERLGNEFILDLMFLSNRLKVRRSGEIVHYLIPRSNTGYMFGVSLFDVCSARYNGAVSYSTAQTVNILGAPRVAQSLAAFLHEVGHDLGASHDASGLMRSDILADPVAEYSPESLDQFTKCLERRSR